MGCPTPPVVGCPVDGLLRSPPCRIGRECGCDGSGGDGYKDWSKGGPDDGGGGCLMPTILLIAFLAAMALTGAVHGRRRGPLPAEVEVDSVAPQ